jgi:hypothetical protein
MKLVRLSSSRNDLRNLSTSLQKKRKQPNSKEKEEERKEAENASRC